MSVELIGIGSANSAVFPALPVVIGPEKLALDRNNEVDPSYLCLISKVADEVVVWDLGGKDGTFVNGRRITCATLKDSDTLGLGGAEFRVRSDPPRRRYLYGVRS